MIRTALYKLILKSNQKENFLGKFNWQKLTKKKKA